MLLPCPFCGGAAEHVDRLVGCADCTALACTEEEWNARALGPAIESVSGYLETRPDAMFIVPEGFWTTQTPDGRMIDGRSVLAIMRAVREGT